MEAFVDGVIKFVFLVIGGAFLFAVARIYPIVMAAQDRRHMEAYRKILEEDDE